MSDAPRILALAGSLRAGSYNRRILALAADGARAAGADVTRIDLRDFPLPVYDADLESASGLPSAALALKERFRAAEGLLFASPEYNSAISGTLKNAFDWVSRPAPGEKPLACFKGKVAALCAASTGALGGIRGLASVRLILGNLGVVLLPDQVALPKAAEAFDDDGDVVDPARRKSLMELGAALARATRALRSPS
ncbi:MAG TPA: NAD(P)H-dependent oxidoreductase [Thermoanaerobaculia bacterium]|jgi:NAD(P)H-dependent FMN reductase|nr:NAD(P)H-dependent oxidoreductase [Thermoanaerobaculia bacterium]HPA49987.1 NAD(P)H-dependent oxidoreductase [Thermoanaerobaculia bacterium]HQN06141.1 NAD(P)H-dependent oxidoreductase [Thermoanaerobaculia bacterium]HQP85951.1 NAD(P)H-dependent oxidoreductase [Thermoanaerobaculia bacterium]